MIDYSVTTIYGHDDVVNIAVQAQYLISGYEGDSRVRQVIERLSGETLSPYQDNNGHTGVTYRLAELALCVHRRAQNKDFIENGVMGVFEYDVTEPMGLWFRDNSECSVEEFAAELDRRVIEWLKS